MSPELSPVMSAVSLVGSAATAAATAYMWLARFRKERPNLQLYPAAAQSEIALGFLRQETRSLWVKLSTVVANYSSVPNAVIDMALDIRMANGCWKEIANPRVTTVLPLNVTSMSTALLAAEFFLALPADPRAEEGNGPATIIPPYLAGNLAEPPQVRVTVLALGDREFSAVLPLPGV